MARYQITAPDGATYEVNAPDSASPDEVKAYVQQNMRQKPKEQLVTAADVPASENFAAGMGKAVSDAHLGLRKIASKVGIGDEGAIQAEIDEAKKRDAPLMNTAAGTVGNVAGNLATAAIPGANTVKGAALISAGLGAVQPTGADESLLKNAAIGGTVGTLARVGGDKLGSAIQGAMASKAAQAATDQAQNAVRDAALAAGQKAGYVVPPSTVKPTLANQAVESVGGKIGTEQAASLKNQKVTDTLARRDLGLNENAPLTDASLAAMRNTEGQAYKAVADYGRQMKLKLKPDQQFLGDVVKIGDELAEAQAAFPNIFKNSSIEALKADLSGAKTPAAMIEAVKKLRRDASVNFKSFDNPEKLGLARAQRQAADALDGLLERSLPPDLSAAYQAARVKIAKIHDVEAALSGGGHVDARVLGKMGDKLTGDLKTIADFAENFPRAVNLPERIGSSGVHALRAAVGAGAGSVLGGVVGGPVGAAAGVAAPWMARNALLSGAGQRFMAQPSYDNPLAQFLANRATGPVARRLSAPIGAESALLYGSE